MTQQAAVAIDHADTCAVAHELLLTWFPRNRRQYWWRSQTDPYTTALVEILLKQTRAEPVEQAIRSFATKYPKPHDLASVNIESLEDDLRAFGLQLQRAQQLKGFGIELVRLGGELPSSLDDLLKLPGIGPYSAAAIRCFAFGQRDAVVDVNVARIVGRMFDIKQERGEARRNAEIIRLSQCLVDGASPKEVNWALLDLGSSFCRPMSADCKHCPLETVCSFAQKAST